MENIDRESKAGNKRENMKKENVLRKLRQKLYEKVRNYRKIVEINGSSYLLSKPDFILNWSYWSRY